MTCQYKSALINIIVSVEFADLVSLIHCCKMNLSRLIVVFYLFYCVGSSYAQEITISKRKEPIEKVLINLERKTGYTFFFPSNLFSGFAPISVNHKNASLEQVLNAMFMGKGISYSIIGKTVVIKQMDKGNDEPPSFIVVTGSVYTNDGKGLPGVSVIAQTERQKKISITGDRGKYTTALIPKNAVLVYSHVGYVDKIIALNGQAIVDVILEEDHNQLNEVQVTAYSTTSRRLNTGNSFTLRSEEFAVSPVPSILQMIQNKVPGLQVTQNTGQIGGSFEVKIRGINGLNSVDPLYIIDGVSYPAGGKNLNPNGISGALPTLENNRMAGTLAQLGGNALNYINPSDIGTIDVLKDADATSIYGSRGAYGVILITTKRGSLDRSGEPSLQLVLNRSLSVTGTFPRLLPTVDYLNLRKEGLKNDGAVVGAQDLDLNGTYPIEAESDWRRELLGSRSMSTRLHARYSGGKEQMSYAVAANFNRQGNVVRSIGYNQQGGAKIDLSSKTKDNRFEVFVSNLLDFTLNTMLPYDFTGDNSIFRAPNAPSYFNTDGTLNWISGLNPYSYINVDYRGTVRNVIGTGNIIYRPIKGLTLKTQVGYNLLSADELRQVPTTVFPPSDPLSSDKASSSSNKFNIRTWSVEPFADYKFPLLKSAMLSITAGMTLQDKLIDQVVVTGVGFASNARLNNPAAGTAVTNRFNKTNTRYMGYFSSLNYNWSNKYILSVSARYDGSTKFAPENRFGWFGSIGGTYIFTEEKFVKEHLPLLSFGKLRASFGTSGGDGIDNFLYLATYSIGENYLGDASFIPNALANRNLRWENNKKRDISISLGFLEDRLLIDAGYYRNTATSLLYGNPLSTITGFSIITANSSAYIENKGLEFNISSLNGNFRKLRWQISAALTIPESRILALSDFYLKPEFNFALGKSPLNVKVLDYAGVNSQTGEYNYKNAKGEYVPGFPLLGNADKTVNVDLAPKFFGSLTNSLQYKSFSLGFTLAVTNKMAKTLRGQSLFMPGVYNFNPPLEALGRWQKPGDITDFPKATAGALGLISAYVFGQSSGAYQRIYYVRLQNLNASYNFTKQLCERIRVKDMKLSFQAQNLFTFSNYKHLDPENSSIDKLPILKVFNIQLAITF